MLVLNPTGVAKQSLVIHSYRAQSKFTRQSQADHFDNVQLFCFVLFFSDCFARDSLKVFFCSQKIFRTSCISKEKKTVKLMMLSTQCLAKYILQACKSFYLRFTFVVDYTIEGL